ncbi:DUF3617 domain-containing protein [Kaarinaea lacus]
MTKIFVAVVALIVVLATPMVNANDYYKGLWEYRINVRVTGMAAKPDLKSVQYCVKELNDLIALFKPDPKCDVHEVKKEADTLTWKLHCKNQGGTYNGDAKFSGDRGGIKGRIFMQTTIPGVRNPVVTTYKVTGTFKGDC